MKKRKIVRPCMECGRRTRSTTRLCDTHRPVDAVPVVSVCGRAINFAGVTWSPKQARSIALQLVNAIEEAEGR